MSRRFRSRGGLVVGSPRRAQSGGANDWSSMGGVRMLRRVPNSLSDAANTGPLEIEPPGWPTARAGLDVSMIDKVAHVLAPRGSEAECSLALAKLHERRPDVVIASQQVVGV